jgi:hypothetical protein
MANTDNGTSVTAPWWVTATVKLGATTVIAMGLVWFITQDIKSGLADIQMAHAAMLQAIQGQQIADTQQTALTNDLRATMEAIRRILSASCANAAKTNTERTTCFQ